MAGFDFKDPTGGFFADLPGGNLLFQSSTEQAGEDLTREYDKAQDQYQAYRPDAMGLRRQSLEQAMQLFGPMGQYVQRMTGAPAPDTSGAFTHLANYEQGLRDEQAAQGQQEAAAQANLMGASPVGSMFSGGPAAQANLMGASPVGSMFSGGR